MDLSFLHGVFALAGWVLERHSGLLVLGLVVAVVAMYVSLSDRITALERLLRRQSERIDESGHASQAQAKPTITTPVHASSATVVDVRAAATVDPWQEGVADSAVTEPFAAADSPGTCVTFAPTGQSARADSAGSVSAPAFAGQPGDSTALSGGFFSSGNWLVRSGLLLLFLGVGFLLKFAADHSAFPLQVRLAGVGAAGIVMVIVGLRLAATRRAYALALQGGGVGLIYLTLYASFALYALLGAGMAFSCLFVVVVLAGWLAHRQQAQVLAVFAALGGFSAPLLVSIGSGSHVLLFAYYALLNVGVLGLALSHAWRGLNLAGFFATFALSALWGHQFYEAAYFATVEPFLVLFFAMYLGIAIAFAALRSLRLQDPMDGTLVFGTPLVAFGLQSRLLADTEYGLAITALCLAMVYAFSAWIAARRPDDRLDVLVEAFIALAIGFATLVVPLAFDARWSSAAWALEGAALVWVGWRQNRPVACLAGALLQLLAGFAFFERSPFSNGWHIGEWLGTLMLAMAGILSSIVLFRSRDGQPQTLAPALRIVLVVWGLSWWFAGGLVQIEHAVSSSSRIGISLLFISFSVLVLEWLGARRQWPPGRYAVSSSPIALVLLVFAALFSVDHPLTSVAALGWPVAIGVLVFILRLRGDRRSPLDDSMHLMVLWLVVGVLSWEFVWQSTHWLPALASARSALWLVVPGVGIVWLMRAMQRAAWPVARREVLYVCIGCWPVVVTMAAVVLLLSVRHPGPASSALYLPVFNPTDLLSIGALVVMMKWWHLTRHANGGAWRVTAGVGIGLVFVWLNGVLLRAVHFLAGVPWEFSAQLSSALVQASMSVLWASTALLAMVLGSRWLRRGVWMIGAALMLAVIMKLLLVDLSSSGTIERIVSFICVGLLLMLVGYLAPVPPRGGWPSSNSAEGAEARSTEM